MPKRVRRSPEFGRWVRDARKVAVLSQQELAGSAKLAQQYLSRVESQGLVPAEDELARICEVVRKPIQEARDVLARTSADDQHARLLEEEFDNFETWLLGLDGPLHIYILRDTPEPVNPTSVELHCSILRKRKDLYISILFRHSAENSWLSFLALATDIDDAWSNDDEVTPGEEVTPEEEPRNRIFGYYRNPEIEEVKGAMPMAVPVILVKVKSSAYLYCYGSHPDVYDTYKQTGEEDYLARFKSIVLLPAPSDSASLFAAWIGSSHTKQELSPKKWVPIPWPDSNNRVERTV